MMRTSHSGQKLIKDFEGCHKILPNGRVEAYVDPVGIWTIGYGHTKTARAGLTVSMAKVETLFLADLDDVERTINRMVTVPLTQNQFDALASFVYNLGAGNFQRSTLLKRLNAGQYEEVPAQLVRWNKGRVRGKLVPLKGLTRRRATEAALFSAHESAGSDGVMQPSRAFAEVPKPKVKSRKFWGSITAGVSALGSWLSSQAESLSEYVGFASEQIGPLLPFAPQLSTIFVVLAVAGVGLAIFAQMDDNKKAQP